MSVGPQSTQVDLFGYMNAHGTYIRTQFRDAYEHGGVFCLDEVDGGSAGVLNALNSALANGSVAFPDGRVKRHPNFVVIATANTVGNGKTVEYVGRAPLDKAFLDRFTMIDWPYDEKMERALGPIKVWTKYVQTVRKLFSERGIKAVISPRATIRGGKAIAAGLPVAKAIAGNIARGLPPEAIALLETIEPPTIVLETEGKAA
jgi:cobaltochelatase CobS